MVNKPTFNYRLFRLACLSIWILMIGGFIVAMVLPLGSSEYIGFISGIMMVLLMLIISGLGFLWEIKEHFRKKK